MTLNLYEGGDFKMDVRIDYQIDFDQMVDIIVRKSTLDGKRRRLDDDYNFYEDEWNAKVRKKICQIKEGYSLGRCLRKY